MAQFSNDNATSAFNILDNTALSRKQSIREFENAPAVEADEEIDYKNLIFDSYNSGRLH